MPIERGWSLGPMGPGWLMMLPRLRITELPPDTGGAGGGFISGRVAKRAIEEKRRKELDIEFALFLLMRR